MNAVDKLREANAKLQELVRFALRKCNADNPVCDACRDHYDGECELEQHLLELLDDVGYSQGWNGNE